MITLKLKYKCNDDGYKEFLTNLMSKYSICLRYLYSKYNKSNGTLSETALRNLSKDIESIESLPNYFIVCATKEAISTWKSFLTRIEEHEKTRDSKLKKLLKKLELKRITPHIFRLKKELILKSLTLIWGGKENFSLRQKHKITKEEFKLNRLSPIYSIGEAQHKGNRLFNFNLDSSIVYKPNKHNHFNLELIYGKNLEKILKDLFYLASENKLPISIKLDIENIYISYDETKLFEYLDIILAKKTQNRVLGIDMNPNYIGWSVVDWKSSSEYKIIDYGTFSFKMFSDEWKKLNDLKDVESDDPRRIKLSNKRRFEVIKVAQNIIKKALFWKCQIISLEDLNMKSKDKNKGKDYNTLCNNSWLRTTFVGQLRKLSLKYKFDFQEVKSQYSSFIGNLIFRSNEKEIFDMELSSIEIGRRGYEFYNQYINKTKQKQKNIIQPNLKDFELNLKISLEILELKLDLEKFDLFGIYNFIKTQKGLPFEGKPDKVRVQVDLNLVTRISPELSFMQKINHG